jgi:hypothetical protein
MPAPTKPRRIGEGAIFHAAHAGIEPVVPGQQCAANQAVDAELRRVAAAASGALFRLADAVGEVA